MTDRFRWVIGDAIHLLLLVACALLAAYPLVVDGRIPLSNHRLFELPPWEEARPDGFERLGNPEIEREGIEAYLSYAFIAKHAHDPWELLWDSGNSTGAPFIAQWSTRAFSPFSIPFYLLDLNTALAVSVLAKLLVAGMTAYFVARRLGFHGPFAFLVGAGFMLGAPMRLWLGAPLSDVLPWAPLFLLFVERIALGQARYWPMGALVMALMLLGGDANACAGFGLFAVTYLAMRAVRPHRRKTGIKPYAAFMCAVLLAFALAAPQIAPFVELVRLSVSSPPSSSSHLALLDLVHVALPGLFGNSSALVSGNAGPVSPRDAALLHPGLAFVMLAVLWCAVRHSAPGPHRHRIDALLGTVLLMGAAGFGLDGRLVAIPGAGDLGLEHWAIMTTLALPVVGAAAGEAWLELNPAQCNAALRRLAFLLPPLAALLGFGIYMAWGNSGIPLLVPSIAAVGVTVAFFGLLTATLLRPSARTLGHGLAFVTIAELMFAFDTMVPYAATSQFFPATPFVESLQETCARIGGSSSISGWPVEGHGVVRILRDDSPVIRRAAQFQTAWQRDPLLQMRAACSGLLLTKADVRGMYASARESLRLVHVYESGAALFEHVETVPRARVIFDGRRVEEFQEDMLASDLPPLLEGIVQLAAAGENAKGSAAIAESRNTAVELRVDANAQGIAVLADTFYPGWTATVDGIIADIVPVDGMFRGAVVPKGAHAVRFTYDPASFRYGLWAMALALTIVFSGWGHLVVLRRFRRPR